MKIYFFAMWIQVNDQKIEFPEGSTGRDLAEKLKLTEPAQAIAMKQNGKIVDITAKLHDGDIVSFLDFAEPEGKEVFWHTSAHVLAQAILRLWPNALPTIGPPIEHGFYYDFANLEISDTDFEKIESEVQKILQENYRPERSLFNDKGEATSAFSSNPYKKELIEGFRGRPHQRVSPRGVFRSLPRPTLACARKNQSLQSPQNLRRLLEGRPKARNAHPHLCHLLPREKTFERLSFPSRRSEKERPQNLRPQTQSLFHKRRRPGMPFIHPKGMVIWNRLIQFWREIHKTAGYQEIKTPQLMSQDLWEMSGHWKHYRENMYSFAIEERGFALKPMNCPGCMLYYRSETHSYRELPLRIAELGHVHRHEASGALDQLRSRLGQQCTLQPKSFFFLCYILLQHTYALPVIWIVSSLSALPCLSFLPLPSPPPHPGVPTPILVL